MYCEIWHPNDSECPGNGYQDELANQEAVSIVKLVGSALLLIYILSVKTLFKALQDSIAIRW